MYVIPDLGDLSDQLILYAIDISENIIPTISPDITPSSIR